MKYGYVKVGAFTPEIKIADIGFNAKSIENGIETAEKDGVEILVFPELSLTGYTCGDLFYSQSLLSGAEKAVVSIAEKTKGKRILVFVGLPLSFNNRIYDVSCAINDGKILGFVPKTCLKNYDGFYEKRYFSTPFDGIEYKRIKYSDGKSVEVPFGKNIIFESVYNEELKVATEIGDIFGINSPSNGYAVNGATVIANLNATPEVCGEKERLQSEFISQSKRVIAGYISAGAGEGESTTDTVFSGMSIIAENGTILAESDAFCTGLTATEIDYSNLSFNRQKEFNGENAEKSDFLFVDFSAESGRENISRVYEKFPFVPMDKNAYSRAEEIINIQAEGLKKRIKHTNAKSLVLGLSGGLDSTLAILVSVRAMQKLKRNPKDIIAVTMPCFGTTSRTFDNTVKLARALKVSLKKVDISSSVKRHLKDIGHPETVKDVTYENSQARERTQVLMDIANDNGGMVIGTGDLSELALGWATYNGDHMSMYGVNCSIPKTLVRLLVSYYADNSKGKLKAVLKDILDTPVSPELLPPTENGKISQKTEDIVGPYILHDFFLYNLLGRGFSPSKVYFLAKKTFNGEFDDQTVLKWLKIFIRRFFNQQFKRSCVPDGVKAIPFGLSPRGDLKMPSDAESVLWLKELENL